MSTLAEGELIDLVTGDAWDGHLLGPYEYRYVVSRQTQDTGAQEEHG